MPNQPPPTDVDEPQAERIDGEKTKVEVEDQGDPGEARSSYDPNLIRVDPKTFSLHQILDMLDKEGELDLSPDFQRKMVWKPWQKSRLIESIFLRIPLPAFYFAADGDGLMHVVDGLQRLSTIRDFVKGNIAFKTLTGLQYLTEKHLGGLTWETLDGAWKRRLQTTQIFVHVIDPQTPTLVKFQIFQRLNQGGSPLTAQEIRNSISRTRSRTFLRECAESEVFRRATDHALDDHPRMADREAVLRFCAFRMEEDIGGYETHESMDDFLTAATRRLDNEKKFSEVRLRKLRMDFEQAMNNAWLLFGRHAFRKWPLENDRLFPLNKPLLESWGCVLADYIGLQLEPAKQAIIQAFRAAISGSEDYRDALGTSTANQRKVRLRFQIVRDILKEHAQ